MLTPEKKKAHFHRPTFNPETVPRYTPFFNPVPIPEFDRFHDVICVPLSRDWIMHIFSCMMTLLHDDQWQGTPDEQKFAMEQWSNIILDLMQENQCMPLDFRNHPDNDCIVQYSKDGGETWIDGWDISGCIVPSEPAIYRYNTENFYHFEVSTDNGETWQDASGIDPRFISPIPDVITGADPRCMAAANMTAYCQTIINSIIDALNAGAIFTALVTLVSGLLAILITGGLALPILLPFITLVLGAGGTALASAFDEAFWQDFLCEVYNALPSDYGEVGGSRFAGLGYDSLINAIRGHTGLAWDVIEFVVGLSGPAGMESMSRTGEGDQFDCSECVPDEIIKRLSTFSNANLTAVPLGGAPAATYDSGQDIYTAGFVLSGPTVGARLFDVRLAVNPAWEIKQILMRTTVHRTRNGATNLMAIAYNGVDLASLALPVTSEPVVKEVGWVGSETGASEIRFYAGVNVQSAMNGNIALVYIEVKYSP